MSGLTLRTPCMTPPWQVCKPLLTWALAIWSLSQHLDTKGSVMECTTVLQPEPATALSWPLHITDIIWLSTISVSSAESGMWRDGGVVGEDELLERSKSMTTASQADASEDGPFGR